MLSQSLWPNDHVREERLKPLRRRSCLKLLLYVCFRQDKTIRVMACGAGRESNWSDESWSKYLPGRVNRFTAG